MALWGYSPQFSGIDIPSSVCVFSAGQTHGWIMSEISLVRSYEYTAAIAMLLV